MNSAPTQRDPSALYFKTVALLGPRVAVFGGHLYSEGTEPTITRLLIYRNGDWRHLGDVPEVLYAMTTRPAEPRPVLCGVGRRGHYIEQASGQSVTHSRLDTRYSGNIEDLRLVGGQLFACGTQRQVHKQQDGVWLPIDYGVFEPLGDRVTGVFHALDGFAPDDLYTAGRYGEIWHWDGQRWTALESPTNYPWYSVHCAENGDVYLGGSNGHLFCGHRDRGWRDLTDSQVCKCVLVDFAEFNGRMYIAAESHLLVLDAEGLQRVEVPGQGEDAFFGALASGYGSLWATCNEKVFEYDGETWHMHICPDNS